MNKQQKEELRYLTRTISEIKIGLERLRGQDITVTMDVYLDIKRGLVGITDTSLSYYVDGSKGDKIDYVTVNELKRLMSRIPVEFKGYDTSVEHKWDYYNDTMDDGELMQEYWDSDFSDEEDELGCTLDIDNKNLLILELQTKKMHEEIYFSFYIDSKELVVEVDEEVYAEDSPYLRQKDVVNVIKSFLKLGDNTKSIADTLVVKPQQNKLDSEDNDKEFIRNIKTVLTDDKFNRLITEETVEDVDKSTLYMDTSSRKATLTRYFKGARYCVNTVNNLPLTLTTMYQVEDSTTTVSTAEKKWETGELAGRYSRILHEEDDYYKYVAFISKHFPSLVSEDGSMKQFKLSIQLGKVEPKEYIPSKSGKGLVIQGGAGSKKGWLEKEILSIVETPYTGTSRGNDINFEQFYKEYHRFTKRLMK